MPIDAQCGSCSTRYKIVDSAAGRQVKCRKCGSAISVPDQPASLGAPLSVSALAELEKTAIPAQTDQGAMFQYQAAVSVLAAPAASPTDAPKFRPGGKVRLGKGTTSIKELAPEGVNFADKKTQKQGGGLSGTAAIVLLLIIGGLVGSYFQYRVAIVASLIFAIVGGLLWMGGRIWGIIVAFTEDSTQGLLFLLVPFYSLYYLRTRRFEMRRPFALWRTGFFLVLTALVGIPYIASVGPQAEQYKEFHDRAAKARSGQSRLDHNAGVSYVIVTSVSQQRAAG